MPGLPRDWRCTVELAPRLDEIERVKQMATLVALVSSCVLVAAQRALALDETIGQKGLVLLTVRLNGGALLEEAVLVELGEDILGDFRLLVRRCPAKDVESDVEPLVDLGVQLVVFVAELFWGALLLYRLGLGRGSVLVGAADEQSRKSAGFAVPGATLSASWSRCFSCTAPIALVAYREKTSAESTLPIMLPKCGTLLTYGKADVMRMFLLPSSGRISFFADAAMMCVINLTTICCEAGTKYMA